MKKFLAVLMSVCMLLAVVGCGGSDDKKKDNQIKDALKMEWTEQEKMFEKAKGTTITKVGSMDDMNEYDKQVTLEFMDRYDISIDWIPMGYSEYTSKLPQMVAAGNPPDTGVMTDATALNFMYSNIAAPINEYLKLDDPYWDMDILNNFKIGDNYYAVNTAEVDTFFVYYNKTLFEEQGIDDPYTLYQNGQWTFDKLREIAKKATIYESDNTTVSCYGIGTHYKEVFALANGGNIIEYDAASGKYVSKVGNANTIYGLNFYKDLIADGSMEPSIAGFTEFPARQIAMFIERPQHAIGAYDLLKTMKDEIGIVPLPASASDGKYYAASNLITNFVPVNAKNPLGGMAWNYFWVRRLIDGGKEDNSTWNARQYKMMTKEHETIINDYFTKATKVSSKLESLSGWGNYSEEFWGGLMYDLKPAEEVSASMQNIITSAINRTIGQ